MAEYRVSGRVRGKGTSSPTCEELRFILPLASVMVLIVVLLATALAWRAALQPERLGEERAYQQGRSRRQAADEKSYVTIAPAYACERYTLRWQSGLTENPAHDGVPRAVRHGTGRHGHP